MLGKYKGYAFTDVENTLGTIHIVRDPRNVITSVKNHYSLSNYDEATKFIFKENIFSNDFKFISGRQFCFFHNSKFLLE